MSDGRFELVDSPPAQPTSHAHLHANVISSLLLWRVFTTTWLLWARAVNEGLLLLPVRHLLFVLLVFVSEDAPMH